MPKTRFIWDMRRHRDSYLMERKENGETIAVYTSEPVEYGHLISQYRDGTTSYYHTDPTQSTRALTDGNQSITDVTTYKAFGGLLLTSGTSTNPFGYKGALGYYANPKSGGYEVRARTYLPGVSRWLSRDSAGFVDGPNPYLYAFGNPINRVDPGGLSCQAPGGIDCRLGRGQFTLVELESYFPNWMDQYTPGTIGSVFRAHWQPDRVMFKEGECCCCTSIGWIQSYKKWRTIPAFPPLMFTNVLNWRIDGGAPYPGGSWSPPNPCAGKSV